jgi:hypothetical protein
MITGEKNNKKIIKRYILMYKSLYFYQNKKNLLIILISIVNNLIKLNFKIELINII